MAHLYPSLNEKFRSEGLCPICLMEMAYAPRFSCSNNHIICHRCRPYYYSCPRCFQPLTEIPAGSPCESPVQTMPHPPHLPRPYPPSAPELLEFYEAERLRHPVHCGSSPRSPPRENQELLECPYAHLGCSAKFVPDLKNMHVSRCQYRHHSTEPVTCSLPPDCDDRVPCKYQTVGCNVRAPQWRLLEHEEICIYKDRSCSPTPGVEELSQHLEGSCRLDEGDPNRMVECRYRGCGCTVRMPLWRKAIHESKCNHASESCSGTDDWTEVLEPQEHRKCRWAEFGCRVRPNYAHKPIHEAKCNYRMEECSYKDRGCEELVHPSRRYAHEKSCGYAY